MDNKIRLYLVGLVNQDKNRNLTKYGVNKIETVYETEKYLANLRKNKKEN